MNNLTEYQKAYIAGFIDGEGCIYIGKCLRDKTPTPVYTLQVVITQSNYSFLQELSKLLNAGSIHKNNTGYNFTNDIYNKNCKQGYSLRFSSRDAYNLLVFIYDYLVIKKKQAQIALEFQKTMDRKHSGSLPGSRGGNKTTKEIIEFREFCHNKLINLKDNEHEDIEFKRSNNLQTSFWI